MTFIQNKHSVQQQMGPRANYDGFRSGSEILILFRRDFADRTSVAAGNV